MRMIVSGQRSRYGTDASTDVTEFQAYKPAEINSAVKKAVADTRGMVLTHSAHMVHAFFHSCSGGRTATAEEGLGFSGSPTPYLTVINDGPCDSPHDEWTATFSVREVARAAGVRSFSRISIGSTGASGRALTLVVGSKHVRAIEIRRILGPDRMKSTLLTSVELRQQTVHMSGKGWGHGVGMSQWGARRLALEGQSAEQILAMYYPGTLLEKLWD